MAKRTRYSPLNLRAVPTPAAVCYGCHKSIIHRSDVYVRRIYGEPLPQFWHRGCAPARSVVV